MYSQFAVSFGVSIIIILGLLMWHFLTIKPDWSPRLVISLFGLVFTTCLVGAAGAYKDESDQKFQHVYDFWLIAASGAPGLLEFELYRTLCIRRNLHRFILLANSTVAIICSLAYVTFCILGFVGLRRDFSTKFTGKLPYIGLIGAVPYLACTIVYMHTLGCLLLLKRAVVEVSNSRANMEKMLSFHIICSVIPLALDITIAILQHLRVDTKKWRLIAFWVKIVLQLCFPAWSHRHLLFPPSHQLPDVIDLVYGVCDGSG